MNKKINELLYFFSQNETVLCKFIKVWKDENSRIIPVIGAGLSVPIYKLWEDALSDIVKNRTFTEKKKKERSSSVWQKMLMRMRSVS